MNVPCRPQKERERTARDSIGGGGSRYVRGVTGRTASGMVQEMLDLAPSTDHEDPLPLDTLPDSSPLHLASGGGKCSPYALISPERTQSSSGLERCYPRNRWKKQRQESADISKQGVEQAWSEEEDDDDDDDDEAGSDAKGSSSHQTIFLKDSSSSSISSCSTSTSEDSGVSGLSSSMSSTTLSDRTHGHASKNGLSQYTQSHTEKKRFTLKGVKENFSSPDMFGRQKKTKEKGNDIFFTMRPKKSKSKQPSGIKGSRLSRKIHKYQCAEAPEISRPAMPIIEHEESENKVLTRQIAVRGKKMNKSVGHDIVQSTIMETSYPLEVTKVTIEFKGVLCEIGCRGK